jgi:hypothetical protein
MTVGGYPPVIIILSKRPGRTCHSIGGLLASTRKEGPERLNNTLCGSKVTYHTYKKFWGALELPESPHMVHIATRLRLVGQRLYVCAHDARSEASPQNIVNTKCAQRRCPPRGARVGGRGAGLTEIIELQHPYFGGRARCNTT